MCVVSYPTGLDDDDGGQHACIVFEEVQLMYIYLYSAIFKGGKY